VNEPDSCILYIDFSNDEFNLGGSSFAQMTGKLGDTAPRVKDSVYFIQAFNAVQELINNRKILAGHDISAGGMITALLEMTFSRNDTGLHLDLSDVSEKDIIRLLFSENPGIIILVRNDMYAEDRLTKAGIRCHRIGYPVNKRIIHLVHNGQQYKFDIDKLRDIWFRTSYLLDRKQCGEVLAGERYKNFKKQELKFRFSDSFTGKAAQFGIDLKRRKTTGIRAAIIREKGVNGDREMAYSLYLAGFDVKDVHMTDLVSGRETLEEINMIVFVGGFSNSDVLGSAKGWAGAFLYNKTAKAALDKFYAREDTLSLGICNGCQLMIELGLVNPAHDMKPKMLHNASEKFESVFLNVDILENHSVMLKSLAGSRLGIWVAHGEGRFDLPYDEPEYHIPVKFSYDQYPGNPNGSKYNAAGLCSEDGRHLVMMPHLERSIFPWHWAYYPENRTGEEITPWVEAFVNAKNWVTNILAK
jgi:phosphoribosylformylglycinamidine synthase